MFRGNIDFVSRTRIEGWVYCTHWSLVGAQVHAFIDDECVGTGLVDLFRQDLVTAGVGDGRGGFNFAITLEDFHDPRELHIRVADGNAIVRQPGSRVLPPDPAELLRSARGGSVESLEWMKARGWINEKQSRVLRSLTALGAYQETLDVPCEASQGPFDTSAMRDAAEILELLAFRPVNVAVQAQLGPSDLASLRTRLNAQFPMTPPVVALTARERCCVNVLEGSHRERRPLRPTEGGGIAYEFGPQSLLWINLDCELVVPVGGLGGGASALVPLHGS
jgi:hypothetical protein